MALNFKNKVVIVTGSTRGIGKAIAKEFAKQGAQVVINARNPERLKKAYDELKQVSSSITSVCADVSLPAEAKRLIDETVSKFGHLDILINNVGTSMRGKFGELKPEIFNRVFESNVISATNTSIYALPHLRKTKGSIIFISSVVGLRGLPFLSAYSASKMSLRAIAEAIRIEEFDNNVHVGLVHVGYTQNENDKEVYNSEGKLIKLKQRSDKNTQTTEQVALAVLKNIRQRKFITTLSFLGKLLMFLQCFLPSLTEYIIIKKINTFEERSK